LENNLPTNKDFDHLKLADTLDEKKYPNVARWAKTLKS